MATNTKTPRPRHAPGKPSATPGENKQSHQPGKEHTMFPKPEYIRPTYKGSGKLDGKVALITGGDSGIGERAKNQKAVRNMSGQPNGCIMQPGNRGL